MSLGLINYGSGNLRSVAKALQFVSASVTEIPKAPIPKDLRAIVLPGVGSFGDSVRQLKERGLFEPIRDWILDGKPFLGICLGYQLLFDKSEESPESEGLSIIPGHVARFNSAEIKVPQIGWNRLAWTENAIAKFPGLPAEPYVYFVHSYYPIPEKKEVIAAFTEYGAPFASAITAGNIFATQFHPEKSQDAGLAILREFVNSIG
ncbi:MAG: imidazole glycerol phosphate synthase subunit HisH [Verrucomicrobia bacterium]|nr:imidazole glycerol phosphate synthase subunit HisH [Verrucomicrobiota bacterium]